MFQYLHGKHRALCFVKLSIRIMIFLLHTPRRRLKILHGKASISDRADSSRRRSQHRTFRQCVQFINQTPPKIYTSNLRKKIFFVLSPPDTQKNKNCTFRINTTISHPQHMYYEDALLHHYSTTTPSQREYPEEIFSCFSIKNWTTRCNYRFLCRTLASVYCILYCRSMTMLYTFREPQSLLLHTSYW